MTSASASTITTGIRPRWAGVDAARGLAVLGMIAAHTVPRPDGVRPELLIDGRPSVLFAVVAGVSLGLMTGGRTPALSQTRAASRLSLVIRAAALFVVGSLLWVAPHGIAVILDYYGVMFLLMVPLLFAPRWVLAGVATALLIAAPAVRAAIGQTEAVSMRPFATITEYLLTGWYPALLWVPLLAVGIIAARSGLERRGVRVALVAGGAVASVAGYGMGFVVNTLSLSVPSWVTAADAHSGGVGELLGSGGVALVIIGAFLVVLDSPKGGTMQRLLWPLRSLGRVALSVYVGHVIVISLLSPLGGAGRFVGDTGWWIFVALVIAGLTLSTVCELLGRRGPLEAAFSDLAALPRRRPTMQD
jgi:uncharacterized membrane protein YeiB